MPSDPPPSVLFEVRVGTHGGPELRVQAGDRSIPIEMAPEQAAALGVALIAASALFSSDETLPAAGETIEGVNLPVTGWHAGANPRSGQPAVQVTVRGGARLVLQFTRDSVAACAQVIQALAAGAETGPESA